VCNVNLGPEIDPGDEPLSVKSISRELTQMFARHTLPLHGIDIWLLRRADSTDPLIGTVSGHKTVNNRTFGANTKFFWFLFFQEKEQKRK